MQYPNTIVTRDLLGLGLYSPEDAGRLVNVGSTRIRRWLRGHSIDGRRYEPLWSPRADSDTEPLVLDFRDLQDLRVAAAFLDKGLSAQRLRQAIAAACELLNDERPLATSRFRTDGRTVFLQIVEQDGESRILDIFRRQFAFREILEQSLSNMEYDPQGAPVRWWPKGRGMSVVVDPARAFGQPIEAETSVPVAVLVRAAAAEGSPEAAARAWDVPVRAVKRAMEFDREVSLQKAA